MLSGHTLMLLTIGFTACAGTSARPATVPPDSAVLPEATDRADARLGPPSPRGLGLRHIDRPLAVGTPLARY